MSVDTLRNKTAIVGIGNTEYSTSSGRSESRLALEAAISAINDAGIDRKSIDGIVRFGTSQANASETWIATNLGLEDVRFWDAVDYGGCASAAMIMHAATAVATGAANYVLCYRALNGRSGTRTGTSETFETHLRGADPSCDNHLVPYGLSAPMSVYSMIAQRRMYEYGTTSEQLGRIAVSGRDNANHNPGAQMYRKKMTLEDHQNSPLISDPLRMFDCCLQTDGAAAVIVTSLERAKDLGQKPAIIAGATQAMLPDTQGPLHSIAARKPLLDSSARLAAEYLYQQTGIKPSEVDVAQIYDCFTVTVLIQLEDYGFCKRGEGGDYVSEGHMRFDGKTPINTDGGNLSCGYLQGLNHILEGTRQIRGTSTRQVSNATTCLVTAGTPQPTSAILLTGEEI
jgi:acetyl-CoA acetyltransferase